MSSANGYVLSVTIGSITHKLRASWAAPYFVVDVDPFEPALCPLLTHCESMEDARRRAAFGGTIFDRNFEPVTALTSLREQMRSEPNPDDPTECGSPG